MSAVSQPLSAALPLTVIEPRPGWQAINLAELWRYRELLFFLVWRDVKVRYKQTALGAAWAILQPLATMAVFTLFLGRVARQPESAVPYALFVLAGLLPWVFFSNALVAATSSVVSSQNLVTKVYFPRLLVPLAAVAAGFVDLLISLAVLALAMCLCGLPLGLHILLAVPVLAAVVIASAGLGVWAAALTVAYRDFRHAVPFAVQIGLFATPAIYLQNATAFTGWASVAAQLNPMNALVANFRAALLGLPMDWPALSLALVVSLAVLLTGCFYFRRSERTFADII